MITRQARTSLANLAGHQSTRKSAAATPRAVRSCPATKFCDCTSPASRFSTSSLGRGSARHSSAQGHVVDASPPGGGSAGIAAAAFLGGTLVTFLGFKLLVRRENRGADDSSKASIWSSSIWSAGGAKSKQAGFGSPHLDGYLRTLKQTAGFRDDQVTTDESELETHGHSPWSYHPARNPSAVIYPSTLEQVQAIVVQAPKHGIVLVPYAGGTSLEAHWAAPPDHAELPPRKVVSVDFALMDRIGKCNVADGDIEVEAGVKYEDLNEHLKEQGIPLFFPVDPGPGAALGGMMGTGGSGTNAVRYGTMRGDYIINATVVLPNGEIITTRSRSRKSSVGPDLTKIFLGSEGTLGLIVKATLRLAPVLPTSIMVVPFPSIHAACSAAQHIVARGVGVQCIELMDDEMIKVVNTANEKTYGKGKYKEHITQPSLFIKLQGSQAHRKEDEGVVRSISGEEGARTRDIACSHDAGSNERLWRARKIALWSCLEAMPQRPEYEGSESSGYKAWTTDVSVPLGSMADLFERVREDTRRTGLHAPIIGHIGDGGAHSIIIFKDGDEADLRRVKAFVHRIVKYAHDMEGTCTSEHGIGRGKRMYLETELGVGTVALLRALKNALDPLGIMNPGSLLYETEGERRKELAELKEHEEEEQRSARR